MSNHGFSVGYAGTRPGVGRKPSTLQKAAGIAQRTAEIAAVGERQHPRRQRHRGAAAAAAARARRVVRIARCAEDAVERLRTGAEFRRVRLADCDCAGVADPFDDQVVALGNVVRRTTSSRTSCACRASAADLCARSAMPHSGGGVFGGSASNRAAVVAGAIGVEGNDCVEARIDAIDLREVRVHHLDAADLPRGEQAGEVDGAGVGTGRSLGRLASMPHCSPKRASSTSVNSASRRATVSPDRSRYACAAR